ncbi:unnamed protein product [Effrenium voratum]|nr:unnamed protein product [Effrenium voratum]CAJ1437905.1 unnamed protein product [Effrenium voratum]
MTRWRMFRLQDGIAEHHMVQSLSITYTYSPDYCVSPILANKAAAWAVTSMASATTFAAGTKDHDGALAGAAAITPSPSAPEDACLYCKKEGREYETDGCGHEAACKKCAMKTATGGKCKVCGQLFSSWRHM